LKFFYFFLELKHPGPGQASRQWVCEVCQAAFHTKSNLTRHRAAAHSLGARLLQCETCGKEFKAAFSDPLLFDLPDQDPNQDSNTNVMLFCQNSENAGLNVANVFALKTIDVLALETSLVL
jgi:hypothetical protein